MLWHLQPDGKIDAQTPGSPALPFTISTRSPSPFDLRIGSTTFRMKIIEVHGSHLIAAQSLANTTHVEQVLLAAELIAGPVLLVGTYLGTFVIGIMASGPVEQSRRRQLEFTQDASHELRTPLSVIQAEVGLALNSDRSPGQYRDALVKVGHESGRLRHIVDDLLWLARFDSYRPTSDSEPLDICVIAESCRERFGSIAQSRALEIVVEHQGQSPALIDAPPDLIERLAGVLVDNACSYAREGGAVHIATYASAHSVSLAVDDNGPGIPQEHRNRLFDRFHRATEDGSGTGLGLAIADSVVRSTTGRWKVSDSPLGGAHMEVSWRPSSLSATGGRRITDLWTWRARVGSHQSRPTVARLPVQKRRLPGRNDPQTRVATEPRERSTASKLTSAPRPGSDPRWTSLPHHVNFRSRHSAGCCSRRRGPAVAKNVLIFAAPTAAGSISRPACLAMQLRLSGSSSPPRLARTSSTTSSTAIVTGSPHETNSSDCVRGAHSKSGHDRSCGLGVASVSTAALINMDFLGRDRRLPRREPRGTRSDSSEYL